MLDIENFERKFNTIVSTESFKKLQDMFNNADHVFYFGHGVLPETNPEKIKFVTNLVRDFK